MSASLRPNRINIDLQGYKQPWLDYCKQYGLSPSEAFRQVVAKLTAGAKASRDGDVERAGEGAEKLRKEIRLTASECSQADALACQEGFALARWIVALVRARLSGMPQLGQHELELLARSNLQILALGRNLNQIARAMQLAPDTRLAWRPELIEQLQAAFKDHAGTVAAVLAANVSRWSSK